MTGLTLHRAAIFLNHRSGQHQRTNWKKSIELALFRSELTFISMSEPIQIQEALKKIKDNHYDAVITVGGDGTIHGVIQEAAGTKTRFLVLPGGTANDLSRQLNHHRSLDKSLELVRCDRWQAIDLIDVNGVLMATNGGIGLVGDVAASVERYRKRLPPFVQLMSHLGHRIYSTVLGVQLLTGPTVPYKFNLRSKEFSGTIETPILLINNQPYLAGSFPVAPTTSNQDGSFNVTVFFHRKLLDLAMAIDRVRRHIPPVYDPNIVSFETTELEVTSPPSQGPCPFFGDGEAMGSSDFFRITVRPQALRVFVDPVHDAPSDSMIFKSFCSHPQNHSTPRDLHL